MKKIKQAAALKYDREKDNAPKVVASGKGYIAEKIIQLSVENNIPLVQDENVVRMLCSVPIDSEIPEELYEAVAEIIAFVFEMDSKAKKNSPVTK
jgi:flagellar biosynthesis protein